ncbi:MAG: thioredoxin fold domain-containing protein [Gammaproteobacteria bacterium]|nr:thioredoxin fold domain-containing protein [Gammaproteobacteria bacterium]
MLRTKSPLVLAVLFFTLAAATVFRQAVGADRYPGAHAGRTVTESGSSLYAVFHHLNQAKWVTEGNSARIMYVFFDPNCPYCHYLYSLSQQFVRAGQVEVRWIPVGLLEPSSEGKAAAILESKNEQAALEKNEDQYHRPGGGGIEETLPSKASKIQLYKNLSLFHQAGPDVVPLIMWEDRNGRIGVQAGAVDKATFDYLIHQIRPVRSVVSASPLS